MKAERYLIIFGIIAGTVVLSFFISPILASTIIPAVCFGVLLTGSPRKFLYLYLFVMGIYPLLRESLLIAPVKYLNELMGVVLFVIFFGHLFLRRLDFRLIKKWKAIFGLLAGYVVLTWLLNRGSPRAAVQTLFAYFSFIPVYILSVHYLTRRDLRILVLGSIGFLWLNLLINVTWFLGINPLPNYHLTMGNMVDVSLGTFYGQTYVAYFCAMLFFILFSFKVIKVNILGRRQNWIINVALITLIFQFYLTYTNHAYLYFCLAFIPYATVTGLWKKWQMAAGVVALAFLIVLTFARSEELQVQFSKENIQNRRDKLAYSAKVQIFNDLFVDTLRTDQLIWSFGAGPGNGMGPIGKDNLTPFALKMLLNYYQAFDMRAMQMTSITGNTTSAIFTLWGDYGLFGFFLFVAVYARFYMQCLQHTVLHNKNNEMRCIATGLVGALTMYIISNITFDVLFMTSICCWLWMFAALLTLPGEDAESSEVVEKVPRSISPTLRYKG